MKAVIIWAVLSLILAASILTHKAVQTPPLPESPQHAVASTRPLPVYKFRVDHPSGVGVEVTLPTNSILVDIPVGFTLTNRMVRTITLDEFSEFKRTNGAAVIYYLVRTEP